MRSEKSNASLGDEHARSPSLSALATTNHEHDHAMATRCEAVRAAGKFQMDLRTSRRITGGAGVGSSGDERRFAKGVGVGAWFPFQARAMAGNPGVSRRADSVQRVSVSRIRS